MPPPSSRLGTEMKRPVRRLVPAHWQGIVLSFPIVCSCGVFDWATLSYVTFNARDLLQKRPLSEEHSIATMAPHSRCELFPLRPQNQVHFHIMVPQLSHSIQCFILFIYSSSGREFGNYSRSCHKKSHRKLHPLSHGRCLTLIQWFKLKQSSPFNGVSFFMEHSVIC